MRRKLHNKISESQVESALVADLVYLGNLIGSRNDLKLIARQFRLQKGRRIVDIIVLDGKEIVLIELKVTKYSEDYLSQIIGYRNELIRLQENKEFVNVPIRAILLVTQINSKAEIEAIDNRVELISYQPLEVLNNYFSKLYSNASFLNVKPNDYGVMTIGKIIPSLRQLFNGFNNKEEVSNKLGLKEGSIHNHFRIAKEFGLVREVHNKYTLTDFGFTFIDAGQEDSLSEKLTENQVILLKDFISKDPFYSSTIFGIYAIVECAILLSRNSYPVDLDELQVFFKVFGGKKNEWNSERTIQTATYTFVSFATDLELLGKIGKQIVLTPSGFKFILMLQLHKSIEMIDNLKR